eukprot:g5518.t1
MVWTVFRTTFLPDKAVLSKHRRVPFQRPALCTFNLADTLPSLTNVLLPLAHVETAIRPVLESKTTGRKLDPNCVCCLDARVHTASTGDEYALILWAACVFSIVPIGTLIYYLGPRSYLRTNQRKLHTPREQQKKLVHGIDVSTSQYLNKPCVKAAIHFAEEAHKGQKRKTGEDYITHCIHTALILEDLLNSALPDDRCEVAMICAVLHDVLDDTQTTKAEIEQQFGHRISDALQKISNLSTMIQQLRRHRRRSLDSMTSKDDHEQLEEDSKLMTLILKTLDDPLILAVKLADRLHNLRTLYALESQKQRAVARETLKIFCTLAERLGLLSLKAEMEDLCFCVLQPLDFLQVYHERELLWKRGKVLPRRRPSRRRKVVKRLSFHEEAKQIVSKMDVVSIEDLIGLVPPFTQVSFALEVLHSHRKKIQYEICMGSFSAGLDIAITGRVKSLYSTATKMKKKGIPIDEVYDILGLKVVVAEHQGAKLSQQVCYKILAAIQSVWKQIPPELDDYIVSPKQSGYQSLHIAVMDRKGIPFEVQIRTTSMEQDAEHGHASHWKYKEKKSPANAVSSSLSIRDCIWGRDEPITGRPVIRIKDGQCRDGVVIRTEQEGLVIIVATNILEQMSAKYRSYTFALRSEYENFQKYCAKRKWINEGCGDFFTCLEKYVLCGDHAYHRIDNFDHKHSTVVRPVPVFDSEKELKLHLEELESNFKLIPNSTVTEDELGMNHRVSHLKSMMGYCDDIAPVIEARDVHILIWPDAKVLSFPRGTTAADVLASRYDKKTNETMIMVNNQLVQPDTTLQDADVIIMQ